GGGDDDPFVIVVSCIPVLLSFRSIAQIGIAHSSRRGRFELAGTPGMCSASSLSHRVLTRQFPAHSCHLPARGRTRDPHPAGGRGLAAVSDCLPARKTTTIGS